MNLWWSPFIVNNLEDIIIMELSPFFVGYGVLHAWYMHYSQPNMFVSSQMSFAIALHDLDHALSILHSSGIVCQDSDMVVRNEDQAL